MCDAPGVYVAGGAIRFVLPRCYMGAVPEGEQALQAALILLRAMARYRLRTDHQAVDEATGEVAIREAGDVDDTLGWLEVSLLLAQDVQKNGPLYVATSQVSPRRQGRIHWARTQQRGFHVVDGPAVMTSPMWRSRHAIDPEDTLTRLHVDTCAMIRRILGRTDVDSTRRWTAAEALSVLDGRDHTLYADRHRRVARWLRQYWALAAGASGARRAGVAGLWAPHFPLVWEAMLREVMGGRPMHMPSGRYRSGAEEKHGMRLVPDFVLDLDQRHFIIDAKHYSLDNPPETSSIAKQLLYRWFASSESGHGRVPIAELLSVFVAPGVGGTAPAWIRWVHELDQERGDLHGFGRVWVVAADFEAVAEAYAKEQGWLEPARVVLEAAISGASIGPLAS